MPQVRATDLAREAGAILQADLVTCCCCTLEGLRETAVAALGAVYLKPQRVTVQREYPECDVVTILIEGPNFRGRIEIV